MFGQNNNDQNQQQPDPAAQNPMMQNNDPPAGFFNPAAPQQPDQTQSQMMSAPLPNPMQDVMPPNNDQMPAEQQGAPMIMDDNPTSFVAPATPADSAEDTNMPASEPTQPPEPMQAPSGPADNDALLGMKQEALQQLQPLVNHLDQSPEEKFRTIMMMIQASDDHTKLNEAFEAAKQITDDKARAQALLDVINEINYFTQHQN